MIGGAVLGHGVATGIAVLGGSILGRYIDERVAQYVGGSLFLVSRLPGATQGGGWRLGWMAAFMEQRLLRTAA